MKLIPEKTNFRISTTDLKVVYTESSGVRLTLDVQQQADVADQRYRSQDIQFNTTAELRCVTLNFFEQYYGEVGVEKPAEDECPANELDFWEKYGYHPNPGFYQVYPSAILQDKAEIFDPLDRLQLKHYLIIGYDSYVEIVASSYDYVGLDSK